ncbi:MAG: peptidyl-prolyl cis-trans isomerase [Thermodesulfobacteriota bacterium]
MRTIILTALLLLSLGLAACDQEPKERGVAARVNGKAISVKLLEFSHGLKLSAPPITSGDVLAVLKAEYGQALAGLIAEELVAQELARRGLEVTEAELRQAGTAVREGYPGKAFEEMLSEEGVDQELWLARLRARLALDKFTARVLRPRVSINSEEVQRYYKEHAQEFAQPESVKFIRVESKTPEALNRALEEAGKTKDPANLLSVFDDVSMQTQASPEEALPREWRTLLRGLAPGQASQPAKGGLGHQAFILLERAPAKVEGLVQVYPLVEKRLIEDKLSREFTAWLTQALNTSVIEISPGLVPEKAKS